jgi:hypothetical protein
MIVHPEFERQLGTNARRRIEQCVTVRRVAAQLLALYQKALGSTDHADQIASQPSPVGTQQEHF